MRTGILFIKNVLGRKFIKPRYLLLFVFCFFSLLVMAQQRITGKIVANNLPIEGATIQVKGSTVSTISGADGVFSINAPANATLLISYVGYANQEIKLANRTSITVTLIQADTQLGEVVVVGYGTQRKSTLTGSVSQVAGAEVAKSPAPNLTTSLAGRLPGLIVNQRTGTPGRDDPSIFIRGGGSLSGFNGVLVVIDGVPRGDMGKLNPQDIESISVLKDGSAAIYGVAGANGVILITTKTGQEEKLILIFPIIMPSTVRQKFPMCWMRPTFAEGL
jgi:TonB-dependent SusC/RagA subfamily outer membrane receptor